MAKGKAKKTKEACAFSRSRVAQNRLRRLNRHMKKHPNDKQSKTALSSPLEARNGGHNRDKRTPSEIRNIDKENFIVVSLDREYLKARAFVRRVMNALKYVKPTNTRALCLALRIPYIEKAKGYANAV